VGVDPKDGSYGGMFSKLLLRELPQSFKSGSGHSHFPYVYMRSWPRFSTDLVYCRLVVPAAMKVHLEKHGAGVSNRYSWDMPAPKTLAQALAPNPSPALAYEMKLVSLLGTQVDRDLVDKVLFSDANLAKWGDNFAATTRDLIESHSIYNGLWKTKHIDIIENVVNLVPIRFLANEIVRILTMLLGAGLTYVRSSDCP
jgi:linoleate 10R-lipoxygenase